MTANHPFWGLRNAANYLSLKLSILPQIADPWGEKKKKNEKKRERNVNMRFCVCCVFVVYCIFFYYFCSVSCFCSVFIFAALFFWHTDYMCTSNISMRERAPILNRSSSLGDFPKCLLSLCTCLNFFHWLFLSKSTQVQVALYAPTHVPDAYNLTILVEWNCLGYDISWFLFLGNSQTQSNLHKRCEGECLTTYKTAESFRKCLFNDT